MITLRSVYDLNLFKAFQKYNSKKIFIFAYLVGVALIVSGILFLFVKEKLYPSYFILGILLPVVVHVFYYLSIIQSSNKNIYLRNPTLQIFTFDEEEIKLEQISNSNNFKDRYYYKDIVKAVKYKQYYFLYINKVQAFVIKNEDYVVGSEEELDRLLKDNLKDRFIIKGKKNNSKRNW